ncbi:hypothetical protein PInf_008135 [Phytophthora infestans]|nr:hypothetical protein PInf_008135 [Phytophthora infestans]
MKLITLLCVALAILTTVQAQEEEEQQQQQQTQLPASIGHDQVKPFAQPQPVTISERAAIKFKPQIRISDVCHPYPAVNDAGETGGGLKTTRSPTAGCKGSGWGSQVYGRSTWHRDVWAIMYSWYFPKDSPMTGLGHRHDWEHVIVWINNPDVPNPTILQSHRRHTVNYESTYPMNHATDITTETGEFQDLIMWDQMTEASRYALNTVSFGDANVPMNEGNFVPKLDKAWPF